MHHVFGLKSFILKPHLGGRLSFLASRMASIAGWPYSAEHLLHNHTLFTEIAPIFDPELRQCVAMDLCKDDPLDVFAHYYRWIGRIDYLAHIRSCPQCRRADRRNYGESYIHIEHQIRDATSCIHHGVDLQECEISADPKHYVALDQIKQFQPLTPVAIAPVSGRGFVPMCPSHSTYVPTYGTPQESRWWKVADFELDAAHRYQLHQLMHTELNPRPLDAVTDF
jgi:hypothetical protein